MTEGQEFYNTCHKFSDYKYDIIWKFQMDTGSLYFICAYIGKKTFKLKPASKFTEMPFGLLYAPDASSQGESSGISEPHNLLLL